MVERTQGDLFDADVAALVNPVNCAGTMSRGLSLQFKTRFAENTRRYKAACDDNRLAPGDVLVTDRGGLFGDDERHRYILNVATKGHWTDASALSHVADGMAAVVESIRRRGIPSLAVPPLGCGGGGLDWADVRPLLIDALQPLNDVRALLFSPRSADPPTTDGSAAKRPPMTRGRALLLLVLNTYAGPDASISPHAVHNLAYLLQQAGVRLNLQFEPGQYGVRAPDLPAVLQRIEDHFIDGYDPAHQDASVRLRPDAVNDAKRILAEHPKAREQLEHVRQRMPSSDTPNALERLVTVHWTMRHDEEARRRPEAAVRAVQRWSRRKAERFSPDQIAAVWRRLRDEDGGGF
jgi:O-acetyl-ADP-ribose deacetylase (regulator of RNase III)